MYSVRSEITEFQCCLGPQTLLYRTAPLLNVLWWRVDFEGGKTDCGLAQDRRCEIEMTGNDAGCRSEVIALLCLRKDVRNIMTLVTPRIHIYGCKENAKGGVYHQPTTRNVVRDACARSEFEFVWVIQTFREALLSANEDGRHIILEHEIGVRVTNVRQRTHVLVTHSDLDCRVVS